MISNHYFILFFVYSRLTCSCRAASNTRSTMTRAAISSPSSCPHSPGTNSRVSPRSASTAIFTIRRAIMGHISVIIIPMESWGKFCIPAGTGGWRITTRGLVAWNRCISTGQMWSMGITRMIIYCTAWIFRIGWEYNLLVHWCSNRMNHLWNLMRSGLKVACYLWLMLNFRTSMMLIYA